MNFLSFLLVGTFWGLSYPAIKIILADFPPFFGAALRVSLSFFFLFLIARVQHIPLTLAKEKRRKNWIAGLFLQGVPLLFLFWGQRFVAPGLTAIINSTAPLWTFFFAMMFLRQDEGFTIQKVLGLMCGICGMFLIYGPHVRFQGDHQELFGIMAITIMSFCYGIGNVMNRQLLRNQTEKHFHGSICHQQGISAILLVCVSFLYEDWPSFSHVMTSWEAVLAMLYLSFFSTALAWILYFRLLKNWGSVRAAGVTYLSPLVSIAVDKLMFGNSLRPTEIIGALTIFAGIFLIQKTSLKSFPLFTRRLWSKAEVVK